MTAIRYALDSSVARQVKLWREIASAMVRLRVTDSAVPLLAIPAPVHAEMMFFLRRERGPAFDPARIADLLDGVAEVVALDPDAAEAVSAKLADWHPTQEAWDAAKRAACADCVGAPRDAQPAKPKRCPATVDWYIAGHAAACGWTVVTEDGGPEWKNVPTIGGADLLAQLEAKLATV